MTTDVRLETLRAELLLPWQIREAMAARPVVYIPLGTIEWHSEHLPVGLDALTAHGVCLRAALIGGGIVLPPLHYGTGGGHGAYPWTVMMEGEGEIAALLGRTLIRLQDFGCKLAVLFSGHFAEGQLAMIDRIAAEWNGRNVPMRLFATAVNRIEGLAIAPDHAGVFETTLLYALHPELVQIGRLPTLDEAPAPPGDDWSEARHDPKHPIYGVFGPDPRLFDPAAAPGLLAASANWLATKASRSLEAATKKPA